MSRDYVIVRGSLGDIRDQVNAHIEKGYVPIGGPAAGDTHSLNGGWVQALYRPSPEAQVKAVLEVHVEDTCYGAKGVPGPTMPSRQSTEDSNCLLYATAIVSEYNAAQGRLDDKYTLERLAHCVEVAERAVRASIVRLRETAAKPVLEQRSLTTREECIIVLRDLLARREALHMSNAYLNIAHGAKSGLPKGVTISTTLAARLNTILSAPGQLHPQYPDLEVKAAIDEFNTIVSEHFEWSKP